MSRLLWFLVGAGAATLWAEKHAYMQRGGPNGQQWCHNGWHQRHARLQEAQQQDVNPSLPSPSNEGKKRVVSAPSTPIPGGSSSPFNWEIEGERLRRQATDAAAELSESTLNTLQTTLEGLREKLQQHKVQREALRQQEEERKRNPPRYV
ncbi:hypothetical protein DL96DRAFT_184129 [Flagelloscypha sp. PMI_526]|nr:hypothetical protein DL96DRAFT_184129 [Flagelloscypha sp. PMI_526]